MNDAEKNPERRIALFQRKEIRRVIHNNEWWFVITDAVAAQTDSTNPTDCLKKIRQRDPEHAKGYGQIVHTLSIPTQGGQQPARSVLGRSAQRGGQIATPLSIPPSAAFPDLDSKIT